MTLNHSPANKSPSSATASPASLGADYWQARYDQGKTGWDRGGPSPMLMEWLRSGALLPCSILVPGCGRGHEVVAMAQAGFQVTAVDFADSAVQGLREELRRQGLRAHVMQTDIFQYSPAQPFDAIYEQTCLCAIDPSLRESYESLLAKWLRPRGRLFALFMQVDNPEGPPFPCPLDCMSALFSDRWRWLTRPTRVDHPMGIHELACLLERR